MVHIFPLKAMKLIFCKNEMVTASSSKELHEIHTCPGGIISIQQYYSTVKFSEI